MRHILTFESSFEESAENKHPKGYSISKFIEMNLANSEIKSCPPENYRDIAWSVDCQINNIKLFFFVGYLGTQHTEWQLIICSDVGLIRRLLGYQDSTEKVILANSIQEILKKDGRFRDLKWFSRYTDSGKDIGYSSPVGDI